MIDYIERRALRNELYEADAVTMAGVAILNTFPAADVVEIKHGQWQKQWHDNSLIGHMYEECSICGCIISDTEKFWDCNYCPNCGASMNK